MIETVARLRMFARPLLGAALAVAGIAAPAGHAQAPTLQMLDRMQPGMWELRIREENTSHRMCLTNGRALIQIKHPGATCQRFIVEDGASMVTVQYTCPGAGYGRTTVRYETPQLAQVESQGIASGTPFDFSAEARRVGPCGG